MNQNLSDKDEQVRKLKMRAKELEKKNKRLERESMEMREKMKKSGVKLPQCISQPSDQFKVSERELKFGCSVSQA